MQTILVRGANDVASAVAHRLFLAGYAVMMHESPQPVTARRNMSFTDAAFDGESILDGVSAQRVNLNHLQDLIVSRRAIPLSVEDFSALLKFLAPQVLVDARMRKHHQPEPQRGLAPCTIGLGPNFIIGQTVDVGIETGWDMPGRIVQSGSTSPLAGEPREIEGHARDRYVYAPAGGVFRALREIGDVVRQGEEVARLDSNPLYAPIAGTLRGITRSGVTVFPKTKVIEVDPRITGAQVAGIGERPAKIAAGVCAAVETFYAGDAYINRVKTQ